MKNASSGLVALLGSSKNFIFADLWTFTLKNGIVLRYSTWDVDLTVGGNLFKSHDVGLVGGQMKQVRGLEVNEVDLTCYPNQGSSPSLVGSTPFIIACRLGLLDRASAQRERLFMPTPNDTSLGTVRIFLGEITEVDPTRNTVAIKCSDQTNILNIYMPRRQYQPTCPWTFGDSNCTVDKAALTVSSAVAAGSSFTTIKCGLNQAEGYFNYGNVSVTSGQNAGQNRSIKNYAPGIVTLNGSFPYPFATGDTFNITPGCSKNLAGQVQSFNAAAIGGSTQQTIFTQLTNANGFFNGGTLQFTSGQNVGQVRTIGSWGGSIATLTAGVPYVPAAGDEMVLTSTSSNSQNSCTGYNNIINFGGQPFIPVPETAY